MKISLHLDDIIYQLQKAGGASVYWREVTSRVSNSNIFNIQHTKGSKLTRLLPIATNADVFHSSHFRVPLSSKTKNIATIHDFTYELGLIKTMGSAINIFQRNQAIRRADAIICVSEYTKKDLLALHPEISNHRHIHVIYHGVSFNISNSPDINCSKRLPSLIHKINGRYILFVGARSSYKNFNAALLGFIDSSLPRQGYTLICTGATFNETERVSLQKLNLQDKVFAFEYATHDELNYLYQNAFALIYPSHYEGFGLPLLEAMSCGCPAIAANSSSLPEVLGDAGLLIAPDDPSTISTALDILLDEKTRGGYITKGLARAASFSWDKTAQQHIEIYQALGS